MSAFSESAEYYSSPNDYEPRFEQPLDELIELSSLIPRGKPNTYGATPLDMVSTLGQQVDLLTELTHYTYSIPEGVSLEIADYVHETFRNRFHSRVAANNENYVTSLVKKSYYEDNPVLIEIIQRAESGHASPAELLITQKLLGIRSVELACLTHPYGERIEMLDEMRATVADSIELMGGECEKDPVERFRIKDVILKEVPLDERPAIYALTNRERFELASNYGGVAGFLVTRKRDLGTMPDGTIIRERSSMVLRTDIDSVLSSQDYEDLRQLPAENWEDSALDAISLSGRISELMATDQHAVAIPIASTIFAFNTTTAEMVHQQSKLTDDTEQLNFDHANQAYESLRSETVVRKYSGMIYIGPEPDTQ